MKTRLRGFVGGGDQGATSVEYALMAMLIALVIITAVSTLGTNLSTFFADTATSV